MSTNTRKLVNIMKTSLSYHDENKKQFHKIARKVCQEIAEALGLAPGTYDIRSNMGGIAVSGEVTLHGESLYLQIAESCMGPGSEILYRKCEGRKDYCGKTNNFLGVSALDQNFERAITCFKSVVR